MQWRYYFHWFANVAFPLTSTMFFTFALPRSYLDSNIHNSILLLVYEETDRFYHFCNFDIENHTTYSQVQMQISKILAVLFLDFRCRSSWSSYLTMASTRDPISRNSFFIRPYRLNNCHTCRAVSWNRSSCQRERTGIYQDFIKLKWLRSKRRACTRQLSTQEFERRGHFSLFPRHIYISEIRQRSQIKSYWSLRYFYLSRFVSWRALLLMAGCIISHHWNSRTVIFKNHARR